MEIETIIISAVSAIIAAIFSWIVSGIYRKNVVDKKIGSAETKAVFTADGREADRDHLPRNERPARQYSGREDQSI